MLGVTAGMVLGVPITNFIANETSIEMAMVFFAVVNAVAFIATWLFIPSMHVTEKLSYGAQLRVLKKPIIWLAIAAVVLLGSAGASVSSYIAEYLETITHISGKMLSLTLFLYGLASLLGNLIGGRLLSKNPMRTVVTYPIVLGLFLSGMGTRYIVLGGIIFLVFSLLAILLRMYMYRPTKQHSR
ncbi:hypothetical protein ASF12_16840 [Paenibacillus sp. Leaf72]|nr:hypothetical protein ASF12_16840 [Paenibacillus sp. Leaf72]